MEKYKKLGKAGEGAHGVVFKAVRLKSPIPKTPRKRYREEEGDGKGQAAEDLDGTGEGPAPGTVVAIKKIRLADGREGLSREAIRELKLLPELRHPNIMQVLDVFNYKSNIHLVLEYMDTDLEKLIKATDIVLRPADIKAYMRMLLLAVEHCHKNWVLHRDLKPGNLLIAADGTLKLSDFGLAKVFGSPDRQLSPQACTLWYRAPELLLGSRHYGEAADMWSVGCIFAELWRRKPLFTGERELQQLDAIFRLVGHPTKENWPECSLLPLCHSLPEGPSRSLLREEFKSLPADALDLLEQLLSLDPGKRPTATQALAHPYFSNPPAPTPVDQLPRLPKPPQHDADAEEDG